MPAYPHEVEEARDEGVQFRWLTVPVRFLGDGRLSGIECAQMRLGKPDASGRPRPELVPGSEFVLLADTVGQGDRAGASRRAAPLDRRAQLGPGPHRGRPESGQTTNERWFAAGDAVNGATVVEAVGGAKLAARGVDAFLGGST